MRAITGAIHSAAGNKKGTAASQKFRFHKAQPAEIPLGRAQQMFSPDPEMGLITPEMIAAERARMGL